MGGKGSAGTRGFRPGLRGFLAPRAALAIGPTGQTFGNPEKSA